MISELLQVAAPYGPVGMFLAYFVWRDERRDRREERRELRREEMDKDRIEADLKVAVAMTLLAERHR
jgi:hypothetical protein